MLLLSYRKGEIMDIIIYKLQMFTLPKEFTHTHDTKKMIFKLNYFAIHKFIYLQYFIKRNVIQPIA